MAEQSTLLIHEVDVLIHGSVVRLFEVTALLAPMFEPYKKRLRNSGFAHKESEQWPGKYLRAPTA